MRGLRDYDGGADDGRHLGPGMEFNLNDATVRASRRDGDECFLDDRSA